MSDARGGRRRLRLVAAAGVAVVLLGAALFVLNGIVLAHGNQPVTGVIASAPATPAAEAGADHHVRVLAWNLAKAFVHRGGLDFASRDEVATRLSSVAATVRSCDPDLVFLSEVVIECTPCDVDQVRFVAERAGLRYWAFGEDYNFGLPFLRVVGGNAILSKRPLQPVANVDLAGRRPFWVTTDNRRLLLCRTMLAGESTLLGSVHADSFDPANNLRQTRQMLQLAAETPTLLAGDFNAQPDSASIAAIVDSGRFVGQASGEPSYPAWIPRVRIDYVFAPASWHLVDCKVLDDATSSDHRPVLSVFELAD